MDGIVALLLSKKFTKDTVIGMGAIKGAPCQVQSIDKVDKTTTVTLKWEDNLGNTHTQDFDIEDGEDGVSVVDATITANGHLELTLSDGNDIDCGKVLPQYDTMPLADATTLGAIYQYIGATDASYTNGYFYECVYEGGSYKWVKKLVQDSYTKIEIGDLTNLPDNTKNVVENIVDINNKIYDKENIFRYNVIPTADVSISGAIIQYLGTTNATYTNGYYYQCVESPVGSGTYVWVQKNVQPNNGGGGGDGVVDGYYNSADQLFYEDSTFLNPITGEDNTLYISLDTNLLYRYNGLIFIRVDESSSGEDDVINGYYNTTDGKFYEDSAYTTEIVGQTGKIYISIDTNIQYRWDNLSLPNKFVTISSSVTVDDQLSTTSENPVQNKVITVPLEALQGSMANKMPKVPSAQQDNFAVFDNSGQVVDSNISKDIVPSSASSSNKLLVKSDIDNVLSDTSENPVQNKVITVPLQALQGSMANKANKVVSATNGNIATLDANGDLADSGFSKDIIPNTATTSNKLATNSDLPTELNDLSDDVVIISPVNNQILAYNSTSGKWENKTGQETIGGIVFKGSILFANLPTTGMSNGDAYDIKDAFTTDNRFEEGSGIACGAGTDIAWIADENKWNILTPAGVYSFNGRTGAVLPATSDYDADQIDYDNTTSGLTATDVQAAIDEIASEKADKVSSATNGHLAGLDSNGNLTDSGVTANKVIEKVTTATGLLKDDGTVDTTSYAPSNSAYLTTDTAETALDDADYVPFYDSSATAKRKSLWSNIKSVLKTYFDGFYAKWETAVQTQDGSTFTFTGLSDNYAYSLFGDDKLYIITNVSKTGSGTNVSITYTVDGATIGDYAYLHAISYPT